MQSLEWISPTDTVVDKEYLARLERLAEILWEVEGSLPTGLESWVDDDELESLRG